MSRTLTKTFSPAWTLPVLPASLRLAMGMGVPLLATVWVLQSRLVALPEGAWTLEMASGFEATSDENKVTLPAWQVAFMTRAVG